VNQGGETCLVTRSMKAHINDTDSSSNHSATSSSDYSIRRQKNNESVRKSRAKNRSKLQECSAHVLNLQQENVQLNQTLTSLDKELYTLKGLFQHCFSFNLDNLAIKPAEIPTSTLYKIIMDKDIVNSSSMIKKSAIPSSNLNLKGKIEMIFEISIRNLIFTLI
jgi:hypothetical protein